MKILNEVTPISKASGMPSRMWGSLLTMKWKPKSSTEAWLASSAMPLGGLGQGLAVVVLREGDEGGEPGMGRRQRARAPVVVHRAQVHVAVDEAGQHDLAGGVDGAVRGRQRLVVAQRHDAAAADGHRGVQHLGGGDDAAAADDGVDLGGGHHASLSAGRTGSVMRP